MGWGIEAMTWCADAVGSLPGAVGHIPQIPTLAFALMIAGGLWLMLWQTRVRLLGLALIIVGIFAAPWVRRPDVLIAQKGDLVAVRDDTGKLSALRAKGSKYDLARWLEYDGDGRSASKAQRGRAFTCDAAGCIAHVNGALVAVARHPAAITDDCGNADVLVLDMPKPKDCSVPVTVIGVFDRWRNGAYALYIDKGAQSPVPTVRVETVAEHRGERPWSVMPPKWKPKPKPKSAQPNGATQILSARSTPTENQKANSAGRSDPPASFYEDPGEKPSPEAAIDDRAVQ
jgi:competence protein ComEC